MIDLHLHTTASDGLLTPTALVGRAAAAGLTTISVTDHDTVAGLDEAAAAGESAGVRVVPGIEITALEDGRDVHVLGYFFDAASGPLAQFLERQRADRIGRAREMGERLLKLGFDIDVEALIARAAAARSTIGRPALADALVAAGQAADREDAFARLLGRGRPAFVARSGAGVAAVIETIHAARGIASLAHPGLVGLDAAIPAFVAAGLDAIEVWHCDHPPELQAHYAGLADRYRLVRSGGSDFHGDGVHRASGIGQTTLPPGEFARLAARAAGR